ncbi:hypothetical protein VPH35_060338 [Triticum aestivum]
MRQGEAKRGWRARCVRLPFAPIHDSRGLQVHAPSRPSALHFPLQPRPPPLLPSEAKGSLHLYAAPNLVQPLRRRQIAEDPAVSRPFSAKVSMLMRCKHI